MPIADYRCKQCKKWKSDHKGHTYHCPIGRGSFKHFSATQTYEADPKKPKEVPFQI